MSMVDDVIISKAAIIERCVGRAREEYAKEPATFVTDFTRQDAAILNIQRACEAALDAGQHLIRNRRLGMPQSARDVFTLLATGGLISADLADKLKKMVGFRNIAVHQYQDLLVAITIAVITRGLDDLLDFSRPSCGAGSNRRSMKASSLGCLIPASSGMTAVHSLGNSSPI